MGLISMGLLFGGPGVINAQGGAAADPELQARQMMIDARSQATLDDLLATNAGAKTLFDMAAGYAVFEVTKAGGISVGDPISGP